MNCFLLHIYTQLRERLKKIGDVGGLKSLGFIDESLLDDDWDPEKHEATDLNQYYHFKMIFFSLVRERYSSYVCMYVCIGDDASAV
jgi:hypothetical protein